MLLLLVRSSYATRTDGSINYSLAYPSTSVETTAVNAWSALDVWCVAILASLLEIQQFAKFIVGDSCDGINKYLKQYLSAYLDGDNVCFDVEASLKEVGE